MFFLSQHDLPYRSIETCFVGCLLLYLLNRILILVQPQPYSVRKDRGGSTLSVVQTEACFFRHSMINPTVLYSETCFVGCRVDCWLLIFAKSYLYPNRILILVQPQPYLVPKARGGSTLSVVQTEACFVRCRINYQFVLLLLLPNGIVIVIVSYPNPGPTPTLLGS